MKSKEDIERYRDMAKEAHRLLEGLANLTHKDLGEDEGFECADGVIDNIYNAEGHACDVRDGLDELLEMFVK
jgi:hypothetical protein